MSNVHFVLIALFGLVLIAIGIVYGVKRERKKAEDILEEIRANGKRILLDPGPDDPKRPFPMSRTQVDEPDLSITGWLKSLPFISEVAYFGDDEKEELQHLYQSRRAQIENLNRDEMFLDEEIDFLAVLMFVNSVHHRGLDCKVADPGFNVVSSVRDIKALAGTLSSIAQMHYDVEEEAFVFLTKIDQLEKNDD